MNMDSGTLVPSVMVSGGASSMRPVEPRPSLSRPAGHAPTYADIEAAAQQLKGVIVETPCIESAALSKLTGARVFLKLESLQLTGSFKTRGSYVKLQSLTPEQRKAGVIAISAGNHAQGVAYHGACLGIATTIVMPKTTPYTKVRRTECLGAKVLLIGATLADAANAAQALAAEQGLAMIHPYEDRHVIAGQGTVALEMLRTHPVIETLVVPVGGGGLISGIALAAKHLAPHCQIVGVHCEANGAPTLAEGIAVKHVGALNQTIIERHVDEMVTVNEATLERTVHLLLEEEKLVVEGAGAAPLAALLQHPAHFTNRNVGLVVSGGNIDSGLLASVILRARFQEGRVARVRVQIVDAPGALAQISNLLANHHANVVDVSHHRAFSGVPAKCAELDFTIEMRRPRDLDSIMQELRDASFEATVLTGIAHAI